MATTGSAWNMQLLRQHLQDAVELELFTIPLYTTAWFSIIDPKSDAGQLLYSIVKEEMLHLELICNVLNAVGGEPVLTGASAPLYPTNIPYRKPTVVLHLGPVSLIQIATFMAIEFPSFIDLESDVSPAPSYDTIGELYTAMDRGLRTVNRFPGSPDRQVLGNFFIAGEEVDARPVVDLTSALDTLRLIVSQGEGTSLVDHTDAEAELAHYWKFFELYNTIAQTPGWLHQNAYYNMVVDPGQKTYSPRSEHLLAFFDHCYSYLLQTLHNSFNGSPSDIDRSIGTGMFGVVGPVGRYIVRQTDPHLGQNLTPRWIYQPVTQDSIQQSYRALAPNDQKALESVATAVGLIT
jgi:hypothetical protein